MKKLLGLFLGLILTLTSFGQYINTSDTVVVTFNGSNGASVNQTFTDTTKFGAMYAFTNGVGLDTINSTVFMRLQGFLTIDNSIYSAGYNNLDSANIMTVLDSSITKFDVNIGSIGTDLDNINITLSNLKYSDYYVTFYTTDVNAPYNVLMVKDTTNLTNIDSNGDLSDTLFITNPDTLQASLSNQHNEGTYPNISGYGDISIDIPNPDATLGEHSITLMVEPNGTNLNYGLIRINYTVSSGSLGLNENTVESKFEVYPNPVNDILYLKTNILKPIIIYNTLGKQVAKEQPNFNQINVSSLKPGVYFITNGKSTVKFIKK